MPIPEKLIGQFGTTLERVNLFLDIHSPAQAPWLYEVFKLALEPHLRNEEYPASALLTKAGNVEFGRGKREMALRFYSLAMRQAESEQDSSMCATVGVNLAHLYISEGRFDIALKVAEQSLALAADVNPKAHVAGLLAAGLALKKLDQKNRALSMFALAAQTSRAIELSDLEVRALMHLSWFDYESAQLDEAILKLRRALDLCALTGNTVDQLRAYFNLGLIQADVGDLQAALRSLNRAKEIRDDNGLKYGDMKIENAIEAVERDLHQPERDS